MKTQTGLIFKPEKPRAIKSEYMAQYLHRLSLIAGRVSQLCVEHDLDAEWTEYRDTITNYGVRYGKGREIQKRLAKSNGRLFKWQQPRSAPGIYQTHVIGFPKFIERTI